MKYLLLKHAHPITDFFAIPWRWHSQNGAFSLKVIALLRGQDPLHKTAKGIQAKKRVNFLSKAFLYRRRGDILLFAFSSGLKSLSESILYFT